MLGILSGVLRRIGRNKWRTAMIATSVAIGVMSVAVIDIIGDGGIHKFNDELDGLGINGISVTINAKSNIASLNAYDVETIKGIANVKNAMGIVKTKGSVHHNATEYNIVMTGIDENASETIALETTFGGQLSKVDIMSMSNVCLIEDRLAVNLFGTSNTVNYKVNIKSNLFNDEFIIIGIIPTEGSVIRSFSEETDIYNIYVPYTKMSSNFSSIAVSLSDSDRSNETARNIKRVLGFEKGSIDAISVSDMAVQREKISRLFEIIKQLLTVIGATSIVVSALSIMTIMLLTVKERTYEIGVKKSIGASNSRILCEFILESGIIALLGGIAGIIFSILISFVISELLCMSFVVKPFNLLLLLAISFFVGCISGAYPAATAAKLNPVDALGRD